MNCWRWSSFPGATTPAKGWATGTATPARKQRWRAAQITDLAANLRARGNPIHLIAGDFNTEPYNDAYAGGVASRREFFTPGTPVKPCVPWRA
ncbi:hypothetical protein SAMN00790413_04664 [Deinococcus hopiensis KR-140]|uniref:Endonuclease/Exonuclease/phosphatase family protein n=1 Tax=Deinococcus hopiensis KR-140 TaxID=695939 RepID=A0A1W1UKK0_9DEIO|nr:hypothetical protein SAMN00790413_04664 [Deinococcus hopiensis KR-140]